MRTGRVKRICKMCGASYLGKTNSTRCGSAGCSRKYMQEKQKAYRSRLDAGQVGERREKKCIICDQTFTANGAGINSKTCSAACKEIRQKQIKKSWYGRAGPPLRPARRIRSCEICNQEISPESELRKFCSEACAKKSRKGWEARRRVRDRRKRMDYQKERQKTSKYKAEKKRCIAKVRQRELVANIQVNLIELQLQLAREK